MIAASEESSTTASKAYAVGDFFRLNGVLYKTTSAIASGGTITPNTNCSSTSLENELGGTGSVATATDSSLGIVKGYNDGGTTIISDGSIQIYKANNDQVKAGSHSTRPIVPYSQHMATFYGLAKAAGANMASSSNAVGTYTSAAQAAIQNMLGVSNIIAPFESDATANQGYSNGDIFTYNGKLYKATSSISSGGTITPNTNCTEINIADELIARTSVSPAAGVSF